MSTARAEGCVRPVCHVHMPGPWSPRGRGAAGRCQGRRKLVYTSVACMWTSGNAVERMCAGYGTRHAPLPTGTMLRNATSCTPRCYDLPRFPRFSPGPLLTGPSTYATIRHIKASCWLLKHQSSLSHKHTINVGRTRNGRRVLCQRLPRRDHRTCSSQSSIDYAVQSLPGSVGRLGAIGEVIF